MPSPKLLHLLFTVTTILFAAYAIFFFYTQILLSPEKLAQNDFAHFYTAGVIAKTNQGNFLYDHKVFQTNLADTSSPYPYPRLTYRSLPFVSLLFIPFSLLPYHPAFYLWFIFNLIFLILICYILKILFPRLLQYEFWPAMILFFLPTTFTLMQGQTSIFTLLFFLLSLIALQKKQFYLSGLLFSSLLIKPHLLFFLGLFLVTFLPKKFFQGLLYGCVSLLLLGFIVSKPTLLLDYPHYLLATETPAFGTFLEKYASLNSILKSLPLNLFFLSSSLLLFLYKFKQLPVLSKLSISILFTLALSPHTPPYELMLLLIPILYYSNLSSILLYSSLVLSVTPGFPPYISIIMLATALAQSPIHPKPPHSSKP